MTPLYLRSSRFVSTDYQQNMSSLFELAPQFQVSNLYWGYALFGAFLMGIAKSGIKGIGIIIVTILAFVFDPKASTGIVLPLLIVGDIMAVIYYNRHAQWKLLMQLLPWMMLGVTLGSFIGKDLVPEIFKRIMAVIIIGSVIMMVWWENKKVKTVPTSKWFGGSMGFLAGVTTMLGNLAGAFSNIFFLAMRLPKDQFIGTAAWLFFIINIFKLPFHIFHWESISMESMAVNFRLFPMVIVGFLVGLKVVEKIKNEAYRKLILVLTAVGAILIFFK